MGREGVPGEDGKIGGNFTARGRRRGLGARQWRAFQVAVTSPRLFHPRGEARPRPPFPACKMCTLSPLAFWAPSRLAAFNAPNRCPFRTAKLWPLQPPQLRFWFLPCRWGRLSRRDLPPHPCLSRPGRAWDVKAVTRLPFPMRD